MRSPDAPRGAAAGGAARDGADLPSSATGSQVRRINGAGTRDGAATRDGTPRGGGTTGAAAGAAESAICLKASSESSQSAARARRPGDEAAASALFGARRPCDAGRSIARTSWQQVGE